MSDILLEQIIAESGLMDEDMKRTVGKLYAQCLNCRHYLGFLRSEAFPDGIPVNIIMGYHDHRQPYKGDKGIHFESKNQS